MCAWRTDLVVVIIVVVVAETLVTTYGVSYSAVGLDALDKPLPLIKRRLRVLPPNTCCVTEEERAGRRSGEWGIPISRFGPRPFAFDASEKNASASQENFRGEIEPKPRRHEPNLRFWPRGCARLPRARGASGRRLAAWRERQ